MDHPVTIAAREKLAQQKAIFETMASNTPEYEACASRVRALERAIEQAQKVGERIDAHVRRVRNMTRDGLTEGERVAEFMKRQAAKRDGSKYAEQIAQAKVR